MTRRSHPELDSGSSIKSGSYSKIADQARNYKSLTASGPLPFQKGRKLFCSKGFTLIELLVVVLIIAILGAIALPQYMVARDRAHLSGLMTIGKNVNDAMNRRSLFDEAQDTTALDLLDITLKSNTGSDCTSGTCRIKVSGKDYYIRPYLNWSTTGRNYIFFYSYTHPAFPALYVFNNISKDIDNGGYIYRLVCTFAWGNAEVTMDADRCRKIARSLGSTCAVDADNCYFN